MLVLLMPVLLMPVLLMPVLLMPVLLMLVLLMPVLLMLVLLMLMLMLLLLTPSREVLQWMTSVTRTSQMSLVIDQESFGRRSETQDHQARALGWKGAVVRCGGMMCSVVEDQKWAEGLFKSTVRPHGRTGSHGGGPKVRIQRHRGQRLSSPVLVFKARRV